MTFVSNKTIEKLKYDLVRDGVISFENLSEAEKVSEKKEQHLSQTLIREGFIEEEVLLKFIQDNLRIPYVNLEDYSVDERCVSLISEENARKYRVLPLFKIENVLTIAMADPLDLFALNNLIKHAKFDIEPIICSERLIVQQLEKFYSEKNSVEKNSGVVIDWRDELNEDTPNNEQAQKIVNSIISQALLENVFEVFLENTEEGLNIKFKKAGNINDKGVIPFLLSPLCTARIKSLCHLDSSITDVPQLGKFIYPSGTDYVTGLVSTFPAISGERISIRIYNPPKTLDKLSINDDEKKVLQKKLQGSGLILIAGPELSGKSFTAYSLLKSIDSDKKNIMSLESIVKYHLKGINQCELNEKVGFSPEIAFKNIDFQSPDVIYVEEIISGRLLDYVLAFAKSGKLVITEVNAQSKDDLAKLFTAGELKEIESNLNYFISTEKLFIPEK